MSHSPVTAKGLFGKKYHIHHQGSNASEGRKKANRAQLSQKMKLFIATAARASNPKENPFGCHSARKKELTLQIKTNQGCRFFRF
jgi:hypothetical protein